MSREEATNDKTCNGCIYEPLPNGNFPDICVECSRWYVDKYKKKKLPLKEVDK